MVVGSIPVAVIKFSDIKPVSSKRLLDIETTKECGFTMKRVRYMIRTYSQVQGTDKYSQKSSIIWPVWLNGLVFVYKLSGCGIEAVCSHLVFRYCSCFEQGAPSHSSNYRVWVHSERSTWHHKSMQISTHNKAKLLPSLAKWLSVCLQTKWLWVFGPVAVTKASNLVGE